MLRIPFKWFELCLNGSKLYSNALNPVQMLGISIRMLSLFPFIFHGCSTCNMRDQCTYQVVLWIHTFLCFLFSLAILGFPSLLPSSFPLPASLLLLPLPTVPKLYSNALNPVQMLGISIRMLSLFPFIFHGCSTCNMRDQCTYQVVLWIHTFLCFLFSLAILGFPSLLPSSFPLPASLLLLPLPTAPTGSSM